MEQVNSLYRELWIQGVEIDHHRSDLYFPKTKETTEILNNFPKEKEITGEFLNKLDGKMWYETPFAYDPYWEKRNK